MYLQESIFCCFSAEHKRSYNVNTCERCTFCDSPSLLLCVAAFQKLPSKMSTAEKRSAEEVPEVLKKAKTAEDKEENIEEEEDDLDEEGEEGEEGEDEEDGEDEGVGLHSMNISTSSGDDV